MNPGCTYIFVHPETLDQHIKAAHRGIPPVYNIIKLINAANETQLAEQGTATSLDVASQVQDSFVTLTGTATLTSPAPAQHTATGSVGPTICTHPTCGKTFTRTADLLRHAKKHLEGPKQFECPAEGCERKGDNGFDRKDKLMDHMKARKHQGFLGESQEE